MEQFCLLDCPESGAIILVPILGVPRGGDYGENKAEDPNRCRGR